MKRFGVLIAVLALILVFGATLHAATKPPTNLKKVGDHWTPWDPPPAGPDAYIIQKGDTLWDLAEKWFQDPFLWPQIWDENRYILDSHWIYPGDPLVVPGRPTVVPDDGPPPVADNTPPATDDSGDDAPPVEPAPPVLIEIASESDLYCSGFISPGEGDPQLWVAGRDTEREILGEGDIVFLNQGSNQGLRAGDTFAIRRWTDPVMHPATEEQIGTMVRRMGRARVLLAHDNSSTAVIEMSCEDIVEGDELVPWEAIQGPKLESLPAFDRLDPSSSGGATGRIVAARDNLDYFGDGYLIHTDLGQHTGVSPGDVLLLFRERESGLPRKMLGQAVVLTVEPDTSTAKITTAAQESTIGDWVEVR
jgi:hypothetical protein